MRDDAPRGDGRSAAHRVEPGVVALEVAGEVRLEPPIHPASVFQEVGGDRSKPADAAPLPSRDQVQAALDEVGRVVDLAVGAGVNGLRQAAGERAAADVTRAKADLGSGAVLVLERPHQIERALG